MDQNILLGAWLEEPLAVADVHYDVAMGNNIYWNLAASPLDKKDCGGSPCRVDFNVIRDAGMHASAPDVTTESGSETVAYEGSDEADMVYGPEANNWNPGGPKSSASCSPNGSKCGYSVARFYYTSEPKSYGSPGYPIGKKSITQGYGKGVLFRETNKQAAQFLEYSDTLSADSYWITDRELAEPSQGGCALFPANSRECSNHGAYSGFSYAQSTLTANYAFNVSRIQALEALIGGTKPVTVDVETGCPDYNDVCSDVSKLTKYFKGKFYIFAASGKPGKPPAANQLVTFHLAVSYTGPVAVIGEHRTVRAMKGIFSDNLKNGDSMHIYEII